MRVGAALRAWAKSNRFCASAHCLLGGSRTAGLSSRLDAPFPSGIDRLDHSRAPRAHRRPFAAAWPAVGLGAVATVAALVGVGGGSALRQLPIEHASDFALRLAAVCALPLPLVVLALVTTPRHQETRLWLGESAEAIVAQGVRAALQVLLASLAAPLALAVVVADARVELRTAVWMVAVAQCGAWLAAVLAVVAALRSMAAGRGLPEALAGGGAFGPAEAAPLLYAPALGLVAGVVPVAVWAAYWGARTGEVLVPPLWLALALPVVARVLALRAVRQADRELYSGLRAALQAHATRFAQALVLPPIAGWLAPAAARGPVGAWLALAFGRHFALAPVVTVTAVAVAALAEVQSGVAAAALAAAVALAAGQRAVAVDELTATAAARWLGAPAHEVRSARAGLAATLLVPAVAVVSLAALGSPWLPLVAGLGVGGAAAVVLAWHSEALGRGAAWSGYAAWATIAVLVAGGGPA